MFCSITVKTNLYFHKVLFWPINRFLKTRLFNICFFFLLYGRFHSTTGVSLAYLRTSISSRVFNQIVGFSGEIVVLHGNATSELSATITTTETRKEAKKNCVTSAHFLEGFVAVIVHCDRRFKNLRPPSKIRFRRK